MSSISMVDILVLLSCRRFLVSLEAVSPSSKNLKDPSETKSSEVRLKKRLVF